MLTRPSFLRKREPKDFVFEIRSKALDEQRCALLKSGSRLTSLRLLKNFSRDGGM